MRQIASSLLFGLLLLAPIRAIAGDLTVVISQVNAQTGSLLAALCVEATYDDPESCPYTIKTRAKAPSVKIVYVDVTPGTYSVQVFHDENDNGEFDTNLLGIPKEGVASSNNAHGSFGPPSFLATAFTMNGGNRTLEVKLEY